MTDYGVAQICVNGHIINSKCNDLEIKEPYCNQCSEMVINKCENCKTEIKGSEREADAIDPPYRYSTAQYFKPLYCSYCGKPFPWTEPINLKVNEIILSAKNLNNIEQEELKNSINELVINNNTENASYKFKDHISKAGTDIGKALKDILIEVVSETVKKSIWGT